MNTQNDPTELKRTERIPYDFLGDRHKYLTEKGPKLWSVIMFAMTILGAIAVFLLATGSITDSRGKEDSYDVEARLLLGFLPYVPAWILSVLRLLKIKSIWQTAIMH